MQFITQQQIQLLRFKLADELRVMGVVNVTSDIVHSALNRVNRDIGSTCDDCGRTWTDGVVGCPHCGEGNPMKGIYCLTGKTNKI